VVPLLDLERGGDFLSSLKPSSASKDEGFKRSAVPLPTGPPALNLPIRLCDSEEESEAGSLEGGRIVTFVESDAGSCGRERSRSLLYPDAVGDGAAIGVGDGEAIDVGAMDGRARGGGGGSIDPDLGVPRSVATLDPIEFRLDCVLLLGRVVADRLIPDPATVLVEL